MENKIILGNCLDKLKELDSNSVDSIVTDPPYELGFMGKSWDNTGIANNVEMWKECLRVLKPGGHLLSFGGTRTYHRMAVAIEDAGFEIRDMIEWVYGSGFPKSLNIGKAVDKLQGNEREEKDVTFPDGSKPRKTAGHFTVGENIPRNTKYTKGTSEWEGWGTALKPAHEPICMARNLYQKKQ
jgi:DNA modification methylase